MAMSDRVQVKCVDRKMWGTRIFGGTSGVIYDIPEGGLLRAISPSGAPDPYDGVLEADAAEFATFRFMRVAGQRPPAPTKKVFDASGGGAPGAEDAGHVPDPDVNGDPDAPPTPLVDQLPAESASKDSWVEWAREHGIALSRSQKSSNKGDLIATITDLAAEKDAQS